MRALERQAWLREVAMSGLGDTETFEATYDLARALLWRAIPGDFVECGVYAGVHPAIMAAAIMDNPGCGWGRIVDGVPEHRVHVFDSFEGLPAAEPRDQEIWAHHKGQTGESACSLEQVKANFARWGLPRELFVFHPGWFEQTVPIAALTIENIAMLRLDGDLYSSTKVCLDYLLPLVSRGGWVCVDDFNLSGCRQAVLEKVVPAPVYFRVPCK